MIFSRRGGLAHAHALCKAQNPIRNAENKECSNGGPGFWLKILVSLESSNGGSMLLAQAKHGFVHLDQPTKTLGSRYTHRILTTTHLFIKTSFTPCHSPCAQPNVQTAMETSRLGFFCHGLGSAKGLMGPRCLKNTCSFDSASSLAFEFGRLLPFFATCIHYTTCQHMTGLWNILTDLVLIWWIINTST